MIATAQGQELGQIAAPRLQEGRWWVRLLRAVKVQSIPIAAWRASAARLPLGLSRRVWRGSCDAETRAAGLFQIRAFGVPGMKRRYHFGNANNTAVRESARIEALIVDLGRRAQLLEDDIAAEEERARVFNHSDAAYPIAARILAVRRENVKATIAMLEKRLASLKEQVEQVPRLVALGGV
jgi:hypothetical protein